MMICLEKMILTDQISSLPSDSNGLSTSSLHLVPKRKPTVSIADMPHEMLSEERLSRNASQRRRSTMTVWMSTMSRRLGRRRDIYKKICLISDTMCCLGLLGLVLMVVLNELTFTRIDHEKEILIWFIQLIISLTTFVLLFLVIYYHYLKLTFVSVHRAVHHWRFALTTTKLNIILIELIVCCIHPFPRSFPFHHLPEPMRNRTLFSSNKTDTSIALSSISFNVAFGLPMFARIYLLCRLIKLRSHLVQNASSQSLGCLNQVSINFFFLIKTYLDRWPTRCLFTFCVCLFFIGSWSLRACNYTVQTEHLSMMDSMWLFIVTFTTVGYGDLTPSSYCGRSVAAFTGVIGVFSTALLISVLARKLQLTRSEKYVHHFDLHIQLSKQRKIYAANIIKFAIQVWFFKHRHRLCTRQQLQAQRKLFHAINANQQLEQTRRKLTENCIGLPEIITLQQDMSVKTDENAESLIHIQARMKQIEDRLTHLDQSVSSIRSSLDLLVRRTVQ